MKTLFRLFNIFFLLYFITLTKEDLCPDGQISVSALGKCKSIIDFLGDESLNLKTENLLYLASNNEGKIEKDDYKLEIFKLSDPKLQSHNMRKSKLYFPNSCLEQMRNNSDILLDITQGIVILVYNYSNTNKNNISDIYFIIRHNSKGANKIYINSKTFDLSFCHEDPILFEDEVEVDSLTYNYTDNTTLDLNTILYGRKFGFDFFDPSSDFLTDICVKFKSEKGTDVTLESRLEDYYQNVTFCDDKESSHYMAYNYSYEKNSFTYRCAFGYYSSKANQDSIVDQIDNKLKSMVVVSNIGVIKCYKQFLNLRDIIKNYGGIICIFVLIIQVVCFLIFCFCGIKPIEEKLSNLFLVGENILKGLLKLAGQDQNNLNTEQNQLNNGQPRKLFNLWGKIKIIRQRKLEREMKLKQELEQQNQLNQQNQENQQNQPNPMPQPQNPSPQNNVSFPPKKRKSIKSNRLKETGDENGAVDLEDIKLEEKDKKETKPKDEEKHKRRRSTLKENKHKEKKEDGGMIKETEQNKEENDNKHKRRRSTLKENKHKDKKEDEGMIKATEQNKEENDNKHKRRRSTLKPDDENKEKQKDEHHKKRKSLMSTKQKNKEDEDDIIKISDYKEEDGKKDVHLDETGVVAHNGGDNIKKVKFSTKNKVNEKVKDKKKGKTEEEKLTDDDKVSEKTQIYEYTPEEMNELPLKRALKYDKRGFCAYYGNILTFSHIILNVFFRFNDYNLFIVKLGLLFMTYPINLTFNIFFYTNKSIKLSYMKSMDDISMFWSNIANTIYSSILSMTLLIILKFICLTHNSLKVFRKFKDVNYARKKSVCVLRCVKIRVTIYFILSLAFLLIFGFYNLCFCAIFENTQVELIKSTLTSWLISLLYPFIICLITSFFRKMAFKFKNRVLYSINQLMQFL